MTFPEGLGRVTAQTRSFQVHALTGVQHCRAFLNVDSQSAHRIFVVSALTINIDHLCLRSKHTVWFFQPLFGNGDRSHHAQFICSCFRTRCPKALPLSCSGMCLFTCLLQSGSLSKHPMSCYIFPATVIAEDAAARDRKSTDSPCF